MNQAFNLEVESISFKIDYLMFINISSFKLLKKSIFLKNLNHFKSLFFNLNYCIKFIVIFNFNLEGLQSNRSHGLRGNKVSNYNGNIKK